MPNGWDQSRGGILKKKNLNNFVHNQKKIVVVVYYSWVTDYSLASLTDHTTTKHNYDTQQEQYTTKFGYKPKSGAVPRGIYMHCSTNCDKLQHALQHTLHHALQQNAFELCLMGSTCTYHTCTHTCEHMRTPAALSYALLQHLSKPVPLPPFGVSHLPPLAP